MTNEVYVIERCLVPGIWELTNPTYYLSKQVADDECLKWIEGMQKYDKKATARVTKLTYYTKQQ